jgi:hypothetical protein
MYFEPGQTRILRLLGEVVEIHEEGGHRRARISIRPQRLIDVIAADIHEVHLGDPVWIEAQVTIRSVQPASAGGIAPDERPH